MYHLVYTSHAVNPLSQRELILLLEECRTFNKAKNITGMLLYMEGKFIQVLEGNKVEVNKLYDNIRKDPRHEKVTLVVAGNSPDRVFKDWSMGFKKLSYGAFEKITGFQDIDVFFNDEERIDQGHLLLVFLKLFYEKNIVDYSEL